MLLKTKLTLDDSGDTTDAEWDDEEEEEEKVTRRKATNKHLMMSYCWADKERVKQIEAAYKAAGVEVWRDEIGSAYVGPIGGQHTHIQEYAVILKL